MELLFGVQRRGRLLPEPDPRAAQHPLFVLISDLCEGGVEALLLKRALELVRSGVRFIALLALSDDGAPAYDDALAATLTALGVPSFACTRDAFPRLIAAAIRREGMGAWAAARGMVVTAKGGESVF